MGVSDNNEDAVEGNAGVSSDRAAEGSAIMRKRLTYMTTVSGTGKAPVANRGRWTHHVD